MKLATHPLHVPQVAEAEELARRWGPKGERPSAPRQSSGSLDPTRLARGLTSRQPLPR